MAKQKLGVKRVLRLISAAIICLTASTQIAYGAEKCFCLKNIEREIFIPNCSKLSKSSPDAAPAAVCKDAESKQAFFHRFDNSWQLLPDGCQACRECADLRRTNGTIVRGELDDGDEQNAGSAQTMSKANAKVEPVDSVLHRQYAPDLEAIRRYTDMGISVAEECLVAK